MSGTYFSKGTYSNKSINYIKNTIMNIKKIQYILIWSLTSNEERRPDEYNVRRRAKWNVGKSNAELVVGEDHILNWHSSHSR